MQRFITEEEFDAGLLSHEHANSEVLEKLRELDVTADSELILDFAFITDTKDKAQELSQELKNLGIENAVDYLEDSEVYEIYGKSYPVRMDQDSVNEWSKEMYKTGYRFDCLFDGWGTSPDPGFQN
ncbi:MAG: hypothetical protein TR69_WS6001000547 [candidate division WS6 bacterium OLB20]|uniref:Regulator of ribonuclease activity B domain-containing protein n=1 Tax=candidate division WS6 bacterium OLB20 TaxID=1617426 RepID=A0A136LY01_9BACT|nr:MAG: hypothetical protein TR69_WS6001000547 [candidate division WS6 bacterium OLB20]